MLDFSTLLPGPMATLMLAEAGAEVTKIERPVVGDEMRGYAPRLGADGVIFALLNRGKKSLALDLKAPADHARALALAAEADVLVEQFRPGVMERLGLSHATLQALNPRLIYCSITGYGQTGPKADRAGHDINYAAETGLLSLVTGSDGAPPLLPGLFADIAGGAYPAVINILLALQERAHTGRGRALDIAMSENMFPFSVRTLASGFAGAWLPANADLVTGATPRYAIYRTRDNRFIAAAPLEDKFWVNFCGIVGVPLDATHDDVARAIALRDAHDWDAAFCSKDVCCSVVATLEEAIADPHIRARGLFERSVTLAADAIPALPLPLVEAYRDPARAAAAPPLS